jgi:hypothetical protein
MCSMSPPSAKWNHFCKKTKSERTLKKLVLQEYNFRKDIKEAYLEVIQHWTLSISVVQVSSTSVITPCFGRSTLSSATRDLTRIVQTHYITQDNAYVSLASYAHKVSVFPSTIRQMWKSSSITYASPKLQNDPVEEFSYLSPIGQIVGRASPVVETGGGET